MNGTLRGFTYSVSLSRLPAGTRHDARCGGLKYIHVFEEVTIAVLGKCAKNHMLMVSEKKRKWVLYGDRASKGHTWTLNSDRSQTFDILSHSFGGFSSLFLCSTTL